MFETGYVATCAVILSRAGTDMTSKAAAVVQSVWTEGKTISDADFLTAETIILSFQCMRIPMKPAVSIAKTMEEAPCVRFS